MLKPLEAPTEADFPALLDEAQAWAAEVGYEESDDGPSMFGIASTRNRFVPEEGTDVAVLHTAVASMVVHPDPRTRSLLGPNPR